MSMQMFATSSKMTACDTYQLLSHEVVAHRGEGGGSCQIVMTHLLFITSKAANLKATLLKLKKNGPDLPYKTL